jgi:hypothetical protein
MAYPLPFRYQNQAAQNSRILGISRSHGGNKTLDLKARYIPWIKDINHIGRVNMVYTDVVLHYNQPINNDKIL